MLGKQSLHLHGEFLDILKQSDLVDDISKFNDDALKDSVQFFQAFGYKEVHSLDVSDYEGADIVFDLNNEVPKELMCKFDVVFDGGVIEHVFDVVTAFTNICKMTKIGGYIFNMNPVYNYLHNTFWNISPEMFVEFYSANNYKILDCSIIGYLSENNDMRPWEDRPIIWSPDVRLMSLIHPLYPGDHVRSLNKLCDNPHPHTFIVAKKMHDGELMKPIVSGYVKKHRGE